MTARTPADDAGDPLPVNYERTLNTQRRALATKERKYEQAMKLLNDTEKALLATDTQLTEARAEADRLRATLGRVQAVIDSEYVPLPEYRTDVAHGAVQVIDKVRSALAADPVSLADVREPCCSAATWEEHMENHHPTDSPDGL